MRTSGHFTGLLKHPGVLITLHYNHLCYHTVTLMFLGKVCFYLESLVFDMVFTISPFITNEI